MKKSDRFRKIFSQGVMDIFEIWVDQETGVNYLYHASGYAGGADRNARARRQAGDHTGAAGGIIRYRKQLSRGPALFVQRGSSGFCT